MEVYSNISQICWSEESSRACGKIGEYLDPSWTCWISKEIHIFYKYPRWHLQIRKFGKPGLREFKTKTKTLVQQGSNLRSFHPKEGLFDRSSKVCCNNWQKASISNLCLLMLMTYGLKWHLYETLIRLLGNGCSTDLGLVSWTWDFLKLLCFLSLC